MSTLHEVPGTVVQTGDGDEWITDMGVTEYLHPSRQSHLLCPDCTGGSVSSEEVGRGGWEEGDVREAVR